MNRPARVVLLGAVAVAVCWWLLSLASEASHPAIASVARADRSVAPIPGGPEMVSTQAAAREPAERTLLVLAADSRVPLGAASLTWVQRNAERIEPLWSRPVDLCADVGGRLSPGSGDEAGSVPLVRAPGYVPQFVDLGRPVEAGRDIEVLLQPAVRLTVSVISRLGQPVEGALVVLSDRPLDRFGDLAATGIGHPLARHPRWQAVSDHTGNAIFDEVPPGTLVLNVVHETMLPVDGSAWNASMDLLPGPHQVVATLAEAEAVVFALPATGEIASVQWRCDLARLNLAPMVTSRLGPVRAWLDRRFPGGLTYVQQRAAGEQEELLVRCGVTMANGSRWSGAWPLTPVTQLSTPVFLEQQVEPVKTIVVHLRDPQDRDYSGIPIRLFADGVDGWILTETGLEVEVPHGHYRVGLTQYQPGVSKAFEDFRFEVGDAPPYEFSVRLKEPVCEVRIHVTYPSDEVLAPLMFYFANESSGPAVICNWRPELGRIRQWMTGKEVSVRVRSPAYEDIDLGPVPADPAKPIEFDAVLRVKH